MCFMGRVFPPNSILWNAAVVDVVVANAHEFANIYGHGQYFYNSTIGNTLLSVYIMIHFNIYILHVGKCCVNVICYGRNR